MTSPAPVPLRRARRCGGLAAVALPLLIGLAACSAPAPTVPADPAGPPAATGAPGPESPAPAAAAPSAVNQSVTTALQSLVASTPQPTTAQVRESLSGAGIAPAAMEVSASRTPTGLAADAVEVGVLGQDECVMAQLRAGTVTTSVLPVLPTGRCFVGSVQQ